MSDNEENTGTALEALKANAVSAGVGLKVLEGLSGLSKDEAKMEQLRGRISKTKYGMISMVTLAAVTAARNDASVDLSAAFGGNEKEEKDAKNRLLNQVRLALGTHEIVHDSDGRAIVQPTKEAAAYLPTGGENKTTQAYKNKEYVRQNFAKLVTNCAKNAASIYDDLDAEVRLDEAKDTLVIAGPKVEKMFGVAKGESVTLDDNQTEGMKAKPSYTTLRAAAERARGGASSAGKTGSAQRPANTIEAFGNICNSFIQAVNSFENEPSKEAMKHIGSVEICIKTLRDQMAAKAKS